LGQVRFELPADLVWILVRNQAETELGPRLGRQHGLRAFSLITGRQTVDVDRRPSPAALENRIALFARRSRDSQTLIFARLVERQRGQRVAFGLRKRLD